MTLESIPILIALAGTAYSAWTDFKTGFVSDFVSHAMIAAGVAFTLYFNLGNLNNALPTFAIAAGVFGIGFLMYLWLRFLYYCLYQKPSYLYSSLVDKN